MISMARNKAFAGTLAATVEASEGCIYRIVCPDGIVNGDQGQRIGVHVRPTREMPPASHSASVLAAPVDFFPRSPKDVRVLDHSRSDDSSLSSRVRHRRRPPWDCGRQLIQPIPAHAPFDAFPRFGNTRAPPRRSPRARPPAEADQRRTLPRARKPRTFVTFPPTGPLVAPNTCAAPSVSRRYRSRQTGARFCSRATSCASAVPGAPRPRRSTSAFSTSPRRAPSASASVRRRPRRPRREHRREAKGDPSAAVLAISSPAARSRL